MQDRQLLDLEVILSRFSVRRAFYIGKVKKAYFDRVSAVHHYAASGFIYDAQLFGASFNVGNWPFSNKSFDLIVLDNVLLNPNEVHEILMEAIRVLSDDGCLIVVQYKKNPGMAIPFRLVNKEIKSHGLHKIESHYYDVFNIKDFNKWLPCLLPESFSCEYIASFSKQIIPLSPLFSGATEMVKLPGKYAIGMNKVFKVKK
ncbi:methyltransferase domain-containing protein [Cysteiniphilum halobium]|uniref:methyltransferase domain-containing protein n=1 Tax=Cysteiniphilum halobium TaxID=2219059 RepID=UPI000E656634|nr:class I SAM-dependent methyltransferase [Cysteiniphilum halobium]